MDQLPVARSGAAATMLGSKIFYCGGYDGLNFQGSCYSLDLDTDEGGSWQEEASLVSHRSSFGLTTVGDLLFVTGGVGDVGVPVQSVEAFSVGEGWRNVLGMDLGVTKYSHCAVAVGSWLYTIGGLLGGKTEDDVSNVVEAYDTSLISGDDPSATWV